MIITKRCNPKICKCKSQSKFEPPIFTNIEEPKPKNSKKSKKSKLTNENIEFLESIGSGFYKIPN